MSWWNDKKIDFKERVSEERDSFFLYGEMKTAYNCIQTAWIYKNT